MTDKRLSDPIFYLHHCNVDRIYAFWEYVYPHYWMSRGYTQVDGKNGNFGMDDDLLFSRLKPVSSRSGRKLESPQRIKMRSHHSTDTLP